MVTLQLHFIRAVYRIFCICFFFSFFFFFFNFYFLFFNFIFESTSRKHSWKYIYFVLYYSINPISEHALLMHLCSIIYCHFFYLSLFFFVSWFNYTTPKYHTILAVLFHILDLKLHNKTCLNLLTRWVYSVPKWQYLFASNVTLWHDKSLIIHSWYISCSLENEIQVICVI